MLDETSSIVAHRLQNTLLILLSLIFLLLDTWVLGFTYLFEALRRYYTAQPARSQKPRRRVLVTGVGMTKGLALARMFHQAGHDVVGADFSSYASGRFSKSLTKFYQLQKPSPKHGPHAYIDGLLQIVTRERIDLWVSCSGVASAVEDGQAKQIVEARTRCKAIQFDVETTKILHEKDSFIQRTDDIGLNIPATYTVKSREDAVYVLRDSPDLEFIMKTVGVDDSVRGNMTLLSGSSAHLKASTEHLRRLRISKQTPWIIQQFVSGPEYCTHALVVQGIVKAFVACPSAELLMHYEALPASSPLSQAMLEFTEIFASKHGTSFTGHLSFDFMVDKAQAQAQRPQDITLYPIECNPRAHTAVALFNNTAEEMAEAYLSLLEPSPTTTMIASTPTSSPNSVLVPHNPAKYYWIGHDLVTLLVLPLITTISTLALRPFHASSSSDPNLLTSFHSLRTNLHTLLTHLAYWKDGTFELWDPLPWWTLYHVYWPLQFWQSLIAGKKWSRINVSTTKMFEC